MLTKKKILIGSLLAVVLFFVSVYYYKVGLCSLYNHSCSVFFDTISAALLIYMPVLLLSLLTYRMHDDIFRQWIKFAAWFVPVDMLVSAVTFYAATSRIGGGLGDLVAGAISTSIVLGLAVLFTVISFVIIAWKYFSARSR